jgi:hypothetical protein
MPDAVDALTTDELQRQYEENQGYLGLSTLGMREGRPVRGGAAQTRELLRRNEAISAELERRGVREEDPQLQRALQRRGQAMPDVAPADAPPFYMKSAQVLDAKIQGKAATVDQVRAILTNPQNGIKAEELKWTGVLQAAERLAKENNGKVPKDALLQYLADDGAVRLEEVVLQGGTRGRNPALERRLEQMGFATDISPDGQDIAFIDLSNPGDFYDPMEMRAVSPKAADLAQSIQELFHGGGGSARFGSYQLPGGENYREVVLAMPADFSQSQKRINEITAEMQVLQEGSIDLYKRAQTDPAARQEYDARQQRFNALSSERYGLAERARDGRSGEIYKSSHFDTPNYVAHMRLNERTDAAGKPGLFLEEIQSDRHQAGREKGYALTEAEKAEVKALEDKARREGGVVRFSSEDRARWDELGAKVEGAGIPDAPFRKDWPMQMFKRALRDAVESGKDWIGWTTGETQAARYDLSQQVNSIEWKQESSGSKIVTLETRNSGEIMFEVSPDGKTSSMSSGGSDFDGKTLDAVVGKEVAEKIMSGAQGDLRGAGLKVGGEGMKGFYDQILPKEISKYVKQWGAQVEKSRIGQPKKHSGKLTRDELAEAKRDAKALINGDIDVAEFNDNWGTRLTDDDVPGSDPYRLNEAATDLVSVVRKERELDAGGTFEAWRVNITPQMREGIKKAGQALFVGGMAAVVAEQEQQ